MALSLVYAHMYTYLGEYICTCTHSVLVRGRDGSGEKRKAAPGRRKKNFPEYERFFGFYINRLTDSCSYNSTTRLKRVLKRERRFSQIRRAEYMTLRTACASYSFL